MMKKSAALVALGFASLAVLAMAPGRAQQAGGVEQAGGAEQAGHEGRAQGRQAPAQQAGQAERGRQVFEYWCAPCHAPGPKHPGTQALQALYRGAKPAPLEQRKDLVPSETKYFVRNGVSIMPPFRKTEITDADLAALAAYLAPKDQ